MLHAKSVLQGKLAGAFSLYDFSFNSPLILPPCNRVLLKLNPKKPLYFHFRQEHPQCSLALRLKGPVAFSL